MFSAQTEAEMKFHGCCNSAETRPLPLLSPGAPGQPPWDGFTLKNLDFQNFHQAPDVLPAS